MKQIILIALSALFLVSCQKEINIDLGTNGGTTGGGGAGGGSGPGADYLKCKINGTAKTFNYLASATKISAGGTTIVSIHGNVNSTNAESLNFGESGSNDIAVGTYSEISGGTSYLVSAVYTDASFAAWGAGLNSSPAHPFTFTVTNITSSRIKGTFSGGMYDNNGFGTNEMLFTEGEFDVAIK